MVILALTLFWPLFAPTCVVSQFPGLHGIGFDKLLAPCEYPGLNMDLIKLLKLAAARYMQLMTELESVLHS